MLKLCLACSLTLLAACGGNELLPESGDDIGKPMTSQVVNPYQRSEVEAKSEALAFLSQVMQVKTRSGVHFSNTHYVLNRMEGVRGISSASDTLLYSLELQGGGSVVVAGDRRVPAVLVYLEDDSFVPSKLTQEEFAEIGEFIKDCLLNNKWAWGDSLELGSDYEVRKYKQGGWKTQTIKQLIPSHWHQGYPYNAKAPLVKGGQRALAGCGAVAVGVLTTYHQHPKSINGFVLDWEAINNAFDTSGNTAYLVRSIGDYLENEWGADATSTKYYKIAPALRKLGYSCSDAAAYDEERVFNNLKEGSPMIMCGSQKEYSFWGITFGYKGGHAWVIDGAIKQEQKQYVSVNWGDYEYLSTETRYYVHCKWGQGNKGDGYYLSRMFNWDDRKTYNKRLRVVYDIKPN